MAEGVPVPEQPLSGDMFAMDGSKSAAAAGPLQMTWNPLLAGVGEEGYSGGDYSLPSGAMDFSHDWAPIVTPAPTQRRSWESTRSGGTPTRPSTSGNSEASRVDALGHALQQGLGLGGSREGSLSGASSLSGSYGDMPVALAEQVGLAFLPEVFSAL